MEGGVEGAAQAGQHVPPLVIAVVEVAAEVPLLLICIVALVLRLLPVGTVRGGSGGNDEGREERRKTRKNKIKLRSRGGKRRKRRTKTKGK